MTERGGLEVRAARWPEDAEEIRRIREAVFVVEQAVPADLEWDGSDAECTHALVSDADGNVIGTGRLAPDGKIGRMAVLREHRGKGAGDAILVQLLASARTSGLKRCYLHAQVHALGFYAKHGFEAHGPEFDEADIPHREMTLEFDR